MVKSKRGGRLVLTVVETSEKLGLGRDAVYRAIDRGDIPSVRIGGRIFVPKASLERVLSPQLNKSRRGTARPRTTQETAA